MDPDLFERWRAAAPPFQGEVAWLEGLPLDRGRSALALAIDALATRFPDADLVGSHDCHEHDGVVLPGWPTSWGDLRAILASNEALAAATPGDTRVFHASRDRRGRFLLRFIVEDGWDTRSGGVEVSVDLTADRATLDAWVDRLGAAGAGTASREPARRWFQERAASGWADPG